MANTTINIIQCNGQATAQELKAATEDNRHAWDAIADWWEKTHSQNDEDGTDMFTQCLIPEVVDLADWKAGETVLDLGAGSGIICRVFAKKGAEVTGLDYSEPMLNKARARNDSLDVKIKPTYEWIDLMDLDYMRRYAQDHPRGFDIITISTTLKSLPSLEPLAAALPLLLRRGGRVIIVDLHPAFSKPAGHRGIEIYEDPNTGKQQIATYIKVDKYLNVPPSKSEAVRGQPEPLTTYHRPFWALMQPFFNQNLVLDSMREPAFKTQGGDPEHPQSYHNFPQTPMLLAFRLKHRDPRDGAWVE